MRVIGLMSGTSFDAIDAAMADIELSDEVLRLRTLGSISTPYADDLREELVAALPRRRPRWRPSAGSTRGSARRSRSSPRRPSSASAART